VVPGSNALDLYLEVYGSNLRLKTGYSYRFAVISSVTLAEVFPCFFLSCKANARV